MVTSTGTGTFGSSESGGGCTLLFGRGSLSAALQGALVVVFDVNFIATAPDGAPAANEVAFRQNLEQYVSAAPQAPGTTPVTTPSVPALSGWAAMAMAGVLLLAGLSAIRTRKTA